VTDQRTGRFSDRSNDWLTYWVAD